MGKEGKGGRGKRRESNDCIFFIFWGGEMIVLFFPVGLEGGKGKGMGR